MKTFITFGRLTKKWLLFLIVPIIMYYRRHFTEKLKLRDANNMFYTGFIRFLGRSINGFLWIILKKRTTASNKKDKKNNKDTASISSDHHSFSLNDSDSFAEIPPKKCAVVQYEFDYNKKKNKKNNIKKFLLILTCIIDFIAVTCNTIKRKTNLFSMASSGQSSLSIVIRLFAIAIFSHFFIDNLRMYKHHYLSIIIIIIVVVTTNIYSFIKEKIDDYFLRLVLMILPDLYFSIMYVCGAKYLSISKGNIFKLLFFDGIIGIFLSILFQIIAYCFIPCDFIQNSECFDDGVPYCDGKKIKTMVNNFIEKEFDPFRSILLIILNFVETWAIWYLIFSFSVNHFGAIYIIPSFVFFIVKGYKKAQNSNPLILIIGNAIIIFMTFVFNEIIILKFCGFDKNTAVEINKRALRELKCDFGEDNDEIYAKDNDNYIIDQEDIEENNDKEEDNAKYSELSIY